MPETRNAWVSCDSCQSVYSVTQTQCGHCGAALHRRKPLAIQRTWALLICSMILFIPANVFPILSLVQFGNGEPQTIVGGTIMLYEDGYKGIATIVFVASICVPVLKIVGLSYLLWTVQRASVWNPRFRTRIFQIIEVIGRWSMLDIFVISILTALVRLGFPATIVPGVAATSFGVVVVLTMLAAISFDPRLMWDQQPGSEWQGTSARA